jgi:hypothetical protein
VSLRILKQADGVIEPRGVGNEDRLSQKLRQAERFWVMQIRHQVFAVQNADNVIERALINRKSRVSRALDHQQHFLERRVDVNRRDFHSRHHDIFHVTFGKLEYPFEHARMLIAFRIEQSA